MATVDHKSPNLLLQSLCCRILGRNEADVAQQFQYAVRVIGSNFAPTVERDEFLVAEKIKKEMARQRREADAALFAELHRKLQSQGIIKNRWAVLYLLLSLSEDPRKPQSKVANYAALFAQALPRDAHSTPYYYSRPQSLPLSYPDRAPSSQSAGSIGSSGVGSLSVYGLNGPTPTPQSLLPGQTYQTTGTADTVRQQLGSRFAWALSAAQPPLSTSKGLPSSIPRNISRMRREGEHGSSSEVTEAALVRDILYVLQGIDGKSIKMCNSENCYKIDSKMGLSKSLRDTASRLAELGWLHNKIRKYTDQRCLDRAFGLVGQSFCASLHQELKEYYRLLSVLHSQIQVEDDQGVNVGLESNLTLRRLLIWTYDPKMRLKTLAALVDHCQGRKGGELASAVHAYTKTGDPYMRSLVQHILSLVSHPILNFLYRWIYDGELEDTYHEFFVASDPTVKTDRLWHDKYTLRKSMIPSFITMDKARKVLLIGKSINFLHQVCQDRTPTAKMMMAVTKSAVSPKDAAELFTDLEGAFQEKIDSAYHLTSKYLLDVLNQNYHLLEHIKAVRRYLLLGQGDFVRHLMDLLKPELARSASTLYQHNLTGILETAVRATNAQFDSPEILKRLDVRLLETELSGVLQQCHILASEMVHFVHQMQYYITFEVLECSWDELWNKLQQAQDLDHITAAHETFLNTIISRCLLDSNSEELLTQLRALFDRILEFQSAQDSMYRSALEELHLRLRYADIKKQRQAEGMWGTTSAEEEAENKRIHEFQQLIPKMSSQIRVCSHFYQDIVQQFLVLLTKSSDESLRFLNFRLDFNEHYKARDPRLRASLGSIRGKRSSAL
ncbi:gamma-tubulin complex component 3 [Rhincodon typus]|uniref:gamma-tubulin complex component 3 n=1 Tax=Rhincodon typus TaxID=259920 RepID=UPI002030B29D|nr:gamma-tubulin complex component 3 [Rhincodon typus]